MVAFCLVVGLIIFAIILTWAHPRTVSTQTTIKLVDEPAFAASGQVGHLDWAKVEKYERHDVDNQEVCE